MTNDPECAEHILFTDKVRTYKQGANGPRNTVCKYYPVLGQQLLLEVICKTNKANEFSPAKFAATTNHNIIRGY